MELMAPAGDFQAAYHAFEHGADAVYLGLSDYSARKSATNFSLEELRRIKQYSEDHDKAVYVALNTIIREEEFPDLTYILHRLVLLRIDGIIVQDLGVAHMIHTAFPSLSLHSSTQLAVHNTSGVEYLRSIGFNRVVLARELTLEEIRTIREECPDIELKVFIHGALCYGFSGLCLASGTILGRSGNRGACGQICRTWSKLIRDEDGDLPPDGPYGFFFSMKDLSLEEQVLRLEDIGIDALKIEGRMKSPEYAAYTAQMYRDILDRRVHDPAPARLAFSRAAATGWTTGFERPDTSGRDDCLITSSYPGHIGIPAGTILKTAGNSVLIAAAAPLAVHDGLQITRPDPEHPGLQRAEAFSISHMTDTRKNRITEVHTGDTAWIRTPSPCSLHDTILKISGHDQQLPTINPRSIRPYRFPITAAITLSDTVLKFETTIPEFGWSYTRTEPLTIEPARTKKKLLPILEKIFASPGEESTTAADSITLRNLTGFPDDEIFIPPKELKEIRRSVYADIEQHLDAHIRQRTETLNETPSQSAMDRIPHIPLPRRSAVSAEGSCIDGIWFLPLSPVQFDERSYFRAIEEHICRIREKQHDAQIVIGINNVGHIPWFRRQTGLLCYIDIYLYCANHHTTQFLARELPGCIGFYYWLEDDISLKQLQEIDWGLPAALVDSDHHPPLFISRSCFRHDSLHMECATCKDRRHTYTLEQQSRRYRVEVRDCMSYVYLDDQNIP